MIFLSHEAQPGQRIIGFAQIMGGKYDGASALASVCMVSKIPARGSIHAGGGFIEDQQLGSVSSASPNRRRCFCPPEHFLTLRLAKSVIPARRITSAPTPD